MHHSLPHHLRATLILGLPLIGSHVAQISIGVVDTIMLGWYSVEALAAVGLGSTYFFTLFILGSGFSWAVLPKVAAAAATGDETQVRRSTRMGLWLGVGYGVAIYPAFWWSAPILEMFQQSPRLSHDAQAYLRIAGLGMVPALFVAGLRATLSGLERTHVVLWATLAGVAANTAGNYVLIFGHFGAPEMGLRGAALASILVHGVMMVALSGYALRALPQYAFFQRLWRPDWPELGRILRLGGPISATLLAECGLFAGSMVMMGWLGTVALATHTIAIQIASITFMVHMGLAAAATVRIGAAFGRQDGPNLRRAALAALILSGGAVVITIAAFLGLPRLLVGAFVDPTDAARPEILALGVTLLALAALFQLFDAAQVMALGFLRGMQDTSMPMVFAWIGYWGIGLPAAYGLGTIAGYGPTGIWLGLVIGLCVAGALLAQRFWRRVAHWPER